MKVKNIILALKDQLPISRLWRNIRNGNVFGLFSEFSHVNKDGKPKVSYGSKQSAIKAAQKMAEKRGVYFSNYKCLYCDGYHIGRNQTSVVKEK